MKYLTLITLFVLPLWACSGAQNNDDNNTNNQNNENNTQDMTPDLSEDETQDMPTTNSDGLVINEVAAAGDPSDWVELYNSSENAIDLSGLFLSDDPGDTQKSAFPSSATTIAPKTYLVIDINDDTVGFKIGGDEQLGIYDASGKEIALVDWNEGDSPAGKSYGRMPDTTGAFKTLNTPTPGAANKDNSASDPVCPNDKAEGNEVCDGTDLKGQSCNTQGFASGDLACNADCMGFDTSNCVAAQAQVVINEITSSGEDDIELYNNGDAPADLSGWYIVDGGYDPNDPTSTAAQRFDFEANTMLAPKAFLVIKKTDVNMRFGLGKQDKVLLYNKDNQVVDQIEYPKDAAEVSYCRFPDGSGNFSSCAVLTSEAANQKDAQ